MDNQGSNIPQNVDGAPAQTNGTEQNVNAAQNSEPATLEVPNEPPPAYDAIYPGAAYYQPQGYGPPQGQSDGTGQYPQTTVIFQQRPPTAVARSGNCPNCQVGYIVQEFSVVGILLAIFCFPCGVLCCLMLTGRRCTSCNKKF